MTNVAMIEVPLRILLQYTVHFTPRYLVLTKSCDKRLVCCSRDGLDKARDLLSGNRRVSQITVFLD